MTGTKTLFLAWQDRGQTRMWYPVGRLDMDIENARYRFRYTQGAKRAQDAVNFQLLHDFPHRDRNYRSSVLFALFRNRIIASKRPDRTDYLKRLTLPSDAGAFEILSVNGGTRVTDSYEVFPKLEKGSDGSFSCRFFLRGWRHFEPLSQVFIDKLKPDERLHLEPDPQNHADRPALRVCTIDDTQIGWTPRYLARGLTGVVTEDRNECRARVVRVNPQPAPSKQRLLIELAGNWGSHQPMSNPDLIPIVE